MADLWSFLGDPINRAVLSWLGGGLVALAAGAWTVAKFVLRKHGDSGTRTRAANVHAANGGIAGGGDVHVRVLHGLSGAHVVFLVLGLAGVLLLGAGLLGGRTVVVSGATTEGVGYNRAFGETLSEFDKAFQIFSEEMEDKAGTAEGAHASNLSFYARWHGELAHLQNQALIADSACPPAEQVDEVMAFERAMATDDATGDANAMELPPISPVFAADRLIRANSRLDAIAAQLRQPDARLTVDQIEKLQAEGNELRATTEQLQRELRLWQELSSVEGGCLTVRLALLAVQFEDFERVHRAQGDLGLPVRAWAPTMLLTMSTQAALGFLSSED